MDEAKRNCEAEGLSCPEGFVRVVVMKPARGNATHVA